MSTNQWMDDPVLKGISEDKLKILTAILENAGEKQPKELMRYFLQSTANAAKDGIYFNDSETELILSVLKQRMSKDELKRVETVRRLANMIAKKERG